MPVGILFSRPARGFSKSVEDLDSFVITRTGSFEEGVPRRSSKRNATLKSAWHGRSDTCRRKGLTSPAVPILLVSVTFLRSARAATPQRRGIRCYGSETNEPLNLFHRAGSRIPPRVAR